MNMKDETPTVVYVSGYDEDSRDPSVEDMENRYVLWSLSLEDFPPADREAGAEKLRAEFRRGLARVREEQREIDLAMHYAYRPEVVAEIAVCLDDDVDWDRIATWCGARIETTQDPSGEYTSVLVLGNRDVAARGMWIVKRLDGTYSVRAEVAEPDASTLTRVRRDAAREALDGYAAAEEDSFLSLHVKDAPIAAAQCTHAAITAREYRDAQYTEETD